MTVILPSTMDAFAGSDTAKDQLRALLTPDTDNPRRFVVTGAVGCGKEYLVGLAAREADFEVFRLALNASILTTDLRLFFDGAQVLRRAVIIVSEAQYLRMLPELEERFLDIVDSLSGNKDLAIALVSEDPSAFSNEVGERFPTRVEVEEPADATPLQKLLTRMAIISDRLEEKHEIRLDTTELTRALFTLGILGGSDADREAAVEVIASVRSNLVNLAQAVIEDIPLLTQLETFGGLLDEVLEDNKS